MIELRGVYKTYRNSGIDEPIIKNLNFKVQAGEFVTIKGKSGSGKSTLLHLIGAIDIIDQGEILIQGRNLNSFSSKERIDYRRFVVAHIFQFFYLFPRLSALENVLLPAQIANEKKAELQERAQHLLQRVGLLNMAHKPAQVLSGGEMQRVAIARALMNAPKLLLADEPTGNLDSKNAKLILDLIQELHREEKLTVILVTHDENVFQTGQVRFEMRDGEIFKI